MKLFRLINDSGAWVELSPLGAGITSIVVPDRNGQLEDVVLGYQNPADYMNDGPCAGKTPGRFANRIARGRFTIDGTGHQLICNDGENALHGGPGGFQNRVWEGEPTDSGIRFSRRSPDGEENYPGNLDVRVEYTWDNKNRLRIDYTAMTDRPTIVNLTNHAYFNLSGHDFGSALSQKLFLPCSNYLRTDLTDIPTGEIVPTAKTPMDFTVAHEIGRDINEDFEKLRHGKGYNHYFLIDGWENDGILRLAAELTDDRSGRRLRVYTTAPGVMLYTGNWLDGSPVNKCGRSYKDYDGVALECQLPPDAPNHPTFPSPILLPGEIFRQTIVYAFD